MIDNWPHFWSSLAVASSRTLSDDQLARLERFLDLLIQANQTMNLTRVVDRDQARLLHIADALTLLPHIPLETKLLTDVGSGGGIPGIPLAIALPATRIILVEATGKKCSYLFDTAQALGLKNVEIRHARAEDVGHDPTLRDQCDVVTARAVAALPWLIEWCLPLVRKGGKLLAMKGPKLQEELPQSNNALKALHGSPPIIHPVTSLPGQTSLVICEITKQGKTSPDHPRPATRAKGKHL
jgi:16S rRNA (guanine527-N7)-methyltransferase